MEKNLVFANRLFLLILSATILIASFTINPRRYGDGREYFMMAESLFNHLSPDLQDRDVLTLRKLKAKFAISHYPKGLKGYFKASDNKSYCYHFWAYPLFNLPVKLILHTFQLNEMKVFQITNALLLILALFHIVFMSKLNELQKMLFGLFVVFCPAFWFIRWTHPEIFSYSFVIISLVYMSRKNWPVSIICAAIASTQNQPLIFLVAFLWIKGIVDSKEKLKAIFVLSFSAVPALAPVFFYYIKYGVPSLLAKEAASLSNVSIFKAWEMFFDLNIGMLPYIPITLLIFFGIIMRDVLLKGKISLNVQLFLLLSIMMLSCTSTSNWNHGTSGPTRYVIWMLPLVFYVVVGEGNFRFRHKLSRSIYLLTLWLAIIVQGFIVFFGGGFAPRPNHMQHTYLARFVLNHFPAIYNPSKEIFQTRTTHPKVQAGTPVVYSYNKKCKKALVKGKDGQRLKSLCGYIPESNRKFFGNPNNRRKFVYINY